MNESGCLETISISNTGSFPGSLIWSRLPEASVFCSRRSHPLAAACAPASRRSAPVRERLHEHRGRYVTASLLDAIVLEREESPIEIERATWAEHRIALQSVTELNEHMYWAVRQNNLDQRDQLLDEITIYARQKTLFVLTFLKRRTITTGPMLQTLKDEWHRLTQ
jgi:hypothetical protein